MRQNVGPLYSLPTVQPGDIQNVDRYLISGTRDKKKCKITRITTLVGPGSSVGIATDYGLDGPGIESRWGARFSAPIQSGRGAHPASCKMRTGSFPGVKSGWRVSLTPDPLLVPRSKNRVELYLYSP
jgi:hypothetical protein